MGKNREYFSGLDGFRLIVTNDDDLFRGQFLSLDFYQCVYRFAHTSIAINSYNPWRLSEHSADVSVCRMPLMMMMMEEQ